MTMLDQRVVESHARRPTTRAWAIIRRAQRAHTLASQRATRSQRRHIQRAERDHPGHHRPSRRPQPCAGLAVAARL
jgi:hypothetical protein